MNRIAVSLTALLLVISLISVSSSSSYDSESHISAPITKGLSLSYYHSSCPKVESIIRRQLKKIFKEDIGQAAGLLRLHFHDCFVQVSVNFWFSLLVFRTFLTVLKFTHLSIERPTFVHLHSTFNFWFNVILHLYLVTFRKI